MIGERGIKFKDVLVIPSHGSCMDDAAGWQFVL